MMKTTLLALIAPFFITACATTEPQIVSLNSSWDSAKAAHIDKDGTNSVKGNAFMRQQGGGVVTCAGSTVTLIPATPYAVERLTQLYGAGDSGFNSIRNFRFVPDPYEYQAMTRRTTCDSQGNFQFERVPDGDYFVVTSVTWVVGYAQQGGNLMQRVRLMNAARPAIVMSR